ncbi:ABC transporter permease [Sanguibacter antarcticus]|uniref:Putative ABC transport system permease protein n=1 Tax=Sanguibacter antarcticus TaxID=372484 RepID=A0A2A9E6V1_9MICO|nr:ABC transporter permease [Sanguibacter antarcticus]PFG34678.1 putative ABC transport system permease protein [Sanguibacter antarcticus]
MRTAIHALADLRAHPWRAALSGVSLTIGVLAVVAIFTISSVISEVFIAGAEQQFGRKITVTGTLEHLAPSADTVRAMLDAADPFTQAGGSAALIVESTSVPGISHPDAAANNEPFARESIKFVAGNLDSIRRLPLISGRWLNSREDYPLEITLNPTAADTWGGVGAQLALQVTPYSPTLTATVVGVAADGSNDPVVYASLPAVLVYQPDLLSTANVQLILHDKAADDTTFREVAERIAAAGGGTLEPSGMKRSDQVDRLLADLRTQQRAFLAIALLALVISALGILNIGLASIGERARELVVRRALGATRSGVISQVLLSSMIIGLIASAAAAAAAIWGVQWWVPQQIPLGSAIEPPGVPWTAVAWGALAAVATTLIGSALPALVAGRLDVATALRD